MIIKRTRGNVNQTQQNRVNLTVEVEGFETKDDGNVLVVGRNISTGEEVKVGLSTEGEMASNPNRNSIKKLMDGYKIGRTQYKLVPGGVIAFSGAFKNSATGEWIGMWPNVLAHNPEDRKQYFAGGEAVLLRMFERRGDNDEIRTSGAVDVFDVNNIKTAKPDELAKVVAELVGNYRSPTFLVRGLNAAGEVIGYTLPLNRNRERVEKDGAVTYVARSPESVGQVIAELAEQSIQLPEGGSYSILPAEQFQVSPKALTGDENSRSRKPAFMMAARAFYEMAGEDRDYKVKEAYMKIGGEHGEFVGGIVPVDPYGKGSDPVLLGGLTYSAEFLASLEAPQENAQEPAAATTGTSSESAPALVGDGDMFDPEDPFNFDGDLGPN